MCSGYNFPKVVASIYQTVFSCFLFSAIEQCISQNNLAIRWFRPRILGDPGRFMNIVNSPKEFLKLHKLVYFDICQDYGNNTTAGAFHQWTIYDLSKTSVLHSFNSTTCLHGWAAPNEGTYHIRVKKFDVDASLVAVGITQFFIKDIWLVSLGDSFASGQGNPDRCGGNSRSHPALWVNSSCYRSSYGSFSYLTYEKIANAYPQHGVLFTYLACSEATIEKGLLGPQDAQEAQVTALLEPIVSEAKKSNKTPDLLLLTIGVNDIGFFDIALQVLMGTLSIDSTSARLQLPEKFENTTRTLQQLNATFFSYGIDPSSIFYFEYFDPMRNEKGKLDAQCAGLFFASDTDFRIAYDTVLLPLNAMIRNQSKVLGWNCIDNIEQAFRTHGVCSRDSYVRLAESSLECQGTAMGTFHPNYRGHQVVTELAWPRISAYLKEKLSSQ